jgi:hypothetical protein
VHQRSAFQPEAILGQIEPRLTAEQIAHLHEPHHVVIIDADIVGGSRQVDEQDDDDGHGTEESDDEVEAGPEPAPCLVVCYLIDHACSILRPGLSHCRETKNTPAMSSRNLALTFSRNSKTRPDAAFVGHVSVASSRYAWVSIRKSRRGGSAALLQ